MEEVLVQMFKKACFEIGKAQGMAGVAVVMCGLLGGVVWVQHDSIKELRKKIEEKES